MACPSERLEHTGCQKFQSLHRWGCGKRRGKVRGTAGSLSHLPRLCEAAMGDVDAARTQRAWRCAPQGFLEGTAHVSPIRHRREFSSQRNNSAIGAGSSGREQVGSGHVAERFRSRARRGSRWVLGSCADASDRPRPDVSRTGGFVTTLGAEKSFGQGRKTMSA